MEIQHPLFWHQGLFLQPQHFQLSDRYVESLFIPYRKYHSPHFWGVYEITVQKAALGTSSFQLSRGTFLFPDGAHVSYPGNAVLESRTFEESWVAGGKPFTVYLGIAKWNDAGSNVTALEETGNLSRISTRFVSTAGEEETVDLHAGGPEGEVKRLKYLLKVFWESETDMAGEYQLIPVAQLERTPDGVELSAAFIPPALTLGSSQLLYALVKEIRDQIASRSRQLEGYKRQRGVQTAEFGSRDVVYLLALRSLNRFVPLLYHYTEARQVHPWFVYGALRQLIGELSSFSETVTALGESAADNTPLLPDYDHTRLGESFAAAHLLILKLLDEITAGPEYVIPLLYDGTYFAAELKPAHFEHRNRYYLVFRTEGDPKAVVPTLEALAKLSSRERLPLLIARALPGIGLQHLPTPPQELPRRAFSLYFQVDGHSEQWALVEKGHNLALYWDNAPEDLEVELMIVGRS
ncbi:type VI secretion system baseplate subunit TssK [Geomonas sp. RF6]|uniref:type VI secretion system baseplate subunit TssK n=1 Tax=Geomonas sp. RF6 TaxID=2897342 RepID=UPI001E63927A|nr:type VI secretion system baseplate subunit TssK [Geomonas sp. RF6]UFS70724.1 type VI secretion system baseplate subunit TssK [Geomonas sp. RF6]